MMTIEHAREVLVRSCGRNKHWFAHRAGWVREAVETALRSPRATDDDAALAVSVELSMHGRTDQARSVLLS
jgi:hypothetical protein